MNKVYAAVPFRAEEVSALPLVKIELEGRPWHTKAHDLAVLKSLANAKDLKAFLKEQKDTVVLSYVHGTDDEPTEFAKLKGSIVYEGEQVNSMAGYASDGQFILFTASDKDIEVSLAGEGFFASHRFDEDELASLFAQIRAL